MGRLKWLFNNPVVIRTMTGIAAFLLLFLVIWLWSIFPVLFTGAALLGMFIAVAYVFGSIIWEIIGS